MLQWKIAQWFELRWWQNYLAGKQKDDYLTWKKNYWVNILQQISTQVKINPADTIADIGCGPAGVFIALPANPVVAVDPLIDAYKKNLPFFKKADYPNVQFVNSTIEDFNGVNGRSKFDVVFCLNAINHVHDIQKGFKKLKNACNPNGRLVVSIDAHNFSFLKYLFRLIPGDVLHPHQYDLEEYKSLLEADGWKVSMSLLLKKEGVFNHFLLVGERDQKN